MHNLSADLALFNFCADWIRRGPALEGNMLFSEAQKEYQIGHYLWSIAQFEVEIALSFPNLRLFNAGYARGVYQFMQRLDKKEQLMLAHGLLKERYSEAAKAVGEAVS